MNFSVYIRPLKPDDALISFQWRNNPRIWEHTGTKPDQYITPELETEWLIEVLKRQNEKRFAICLKKDDRYIGNIYLTNVTHQDAEVHIFIGEVGLWGKNKAFEAICLIGMYAFHTLGLEYVYAEIKDKNRATNALAVAVGGAQIEEYHDEKQGRTIRRWVFSRQMFEESTELRPDSNEKKI